MLAGVMKGVYKHAGLLRAGIASAGNDHRLGANEAPPAIISIFMGDLLTRILNQIEEGAASGQGAEAAVIKLGVSQLPEVMRDNTDRNRTSPFAFTGNKFEFRAVGSSASTAFPVTLLNAAVADGFADLVKALRAKGGKGKVNEATVMEVIRDTIKETKAIRFEGNGYSEEWVNEANKRSLPNLRKTPEALAQLVTAESKKLMSSLGIFSEAELVSRFHVRVERYVKNLLIEIDTLRSMVDTQILPAAFAYHSVLSSGIASAKAAGLTAPQTVVAERLGKLIAALQSKREKLERAFHRVETLGSEEEKSQHLATEVSTLMAEIRTDCDEIESVVADDFWPLPKYREMLFLS
jgi:glutamine synthetase